jgi:hypothetical protein
MTLSEFIAKWDIRFADNDLFLVDETDLREFKDDLAQLIGAGSLSGRTLAELSYPMGVTAGGWYVSSSGIWEARRDFTASAFPMAGPNWRLVVSLRPDVTAADITDASAAGRSMLTAGSAAVQLGLVDKLDIKADQYGDHPAFSRAYTDQGLLLYMFRKLMQPAVVPVVQAPAAPTEPQVDDTSDTLSGILVAGYPAVADYEVFGSPDFPGIVNASVASGDIQNGRIISRGLKGTILVGSAGIRVAANGSRPAGAWMLNDKAFAGVFTPPTPLPTGDTTPPSVSFTVPASGATLTPNTQVLLTVIANDNVAVAGLTFTDGATGQVLGQGAKNGSTYTFPYSVGAVGPLSLVATATDAAGNSQSATVNVTVGSGTTTPPTNTTPDAPFPSYDPVTRVLTFQHALGTSELEYNRFGGTFTSYAPIQVDDSSHSAGEWKARVKAMLGRNASGTADSPAITAKATINQLPVANAGDDLKITAPTSSVALMGTASDPDSGDSLTYLWRQITGPAGAGTATGLPATSLNVVVSNLAIGTYQFGFQATDQKGGKSQEDWVVVTVDAAGTVTVVPVDWYSGQSLCLGTATNAEHTKAPINGAITPSMDDEFQRVKIYAPASDTWPKLGPATNLSSTGLNVQGVIRPASYGMETPMAQLFENQNSAGERRVFKLSGDGQSIVRWDPNDAAGNTAEMIRQDKKGKTKALAEGVALACENFFWIQGQADFNMPVAEYLSRFNALYQALLSAGVFTSSTKVHLVAPSFGNARTAQLQWIDQNPTVGRFVEIADLSSNNPLYSYDGTHLTSEGTIIQAERAYASAHGGNAKVYAHAPIIDTAPEFLSFDPVEGPVGTPVEIGGSNFSSTMKVLFRGTEATEITRISSTRVIAKVPAGAFSGLIALRNGTTTVNATLIFTVTGSSTPPAGGGTDKQPQFAGYLPIDKGETGSSVTASGADFSSTMKAYVISYPGGVVTEATVTSRTGTDTVVFTIPLVAPGKYIFRLANGTLSMDSNPANAFTITENANRYTSFFPSKAPAGSQQLHIGNGFAQPAVITYPSGSAAASIVSSSSGGVVSVVPANAGSGKIKIQGSTAGLLTSIVDFTFDPTAKSLIFLLAESFTNALLLAWQQGNTVDGPLGPLVVVGSDGGVFSPRVGGSNHCAITTVDRYDTLGRLFLVHLKQPLNKLPTTDFIIAVGGTLWLYILENGKLYASFMGVTMKVFEYDSIAHAFLGMANVNGDAVFLTSPDGSNWTEQVRTSGAPSNADFCLDASTNGYEPNPGTAIVRMAAIINY